MNTPAESHRTPTDPMCSSSSMHTDLSKSQVMATRANALSEAQSVAPASRRKRAATVTARSARSKESITPPEPATSPMAPTAPPRPPGVPAPATTSSQSQPEASTSAPPCKPRKPRKRWTMEETQALVDGCNKWGVGNWKAILNDSQFQFQGRSPVDLKDRFRTYFPDAYRHHYPNAKTHLSSRVRSFLPDGTSIFEKTRSKKRRPFSAEEDEALRLGYEKHGTTWATIVKDPIFASQERRSTDLRDRFRNAFPELYKAAGYKPRPRANTSASRTAIASSSSTLPPPSQTPTEPARKGRRGRSGTMPIVATKPIDDVSGQIVERSPIGHRKRQSTSVVGERTASADATALDFYRPRSQTTTTSSASTPKVNPEDIPLSDSDESSSECDYEEEEQFFALSSGKEKSSPRMHTETVFATPALPPPKTEVKDEDMDVDGEDIFSHPTHERLGLDSLDRTNLLRNVNDSSLRATGSDPTHSIATTSTPVSTSLQELLDSATGAVVTPINLSRSDQSSGFDGTVQGRMHSHRNNPSITSLNTSAASDTWESISSHAGFCSSVLPSSTSAPWISSPASPAPSDLFRQPQGPCPPGATATRIGKSAWGPQDWLSSNPRLDHNLGLLGGTGALTSWPTPSTDPHAVLDRYDLYSTVEAAHDFASEANIRYNHNNSSHTHSYPDESIFRGFTHHRYAGDLIPGSGVAVHPPNLHVTANNLSLGALGLGLAGLSNLQDDYASSVTSGSHIGLAGMGPLQDIDELSVANHASSASQSGVNSPIKRSVEQELDLDAMIVVEAEDRQVSGSGAPTARGATPSGRPRPSAAMPSSAAVEDAGVITPTSLNPASLPCPPSPLTLGEGRLPDLQQYRRDPPPLSNRMYSRSVNHGVTVSPFRMSTPPGWRDASRSISQPPSEHRQALQRSLSYLDPISSHVGLLSFPDDPLGFSEPPSISSLDLQYGMSSGPNIFTPLTMFTDPPSIAPLRTVHTNPSRFATHSPLPQPPPVEEALDLSALIHTSPVPASRNHQRHQSQSVASPRGDREGDKKKRSSWDGGLFPFLPPPANTHVAPSDDSLFSEFDKKPQHLQ
ncbi:hypothetical protein FRB99_000075 [Tulasnella sp. 403]|nr:hypothetical protein FRB99_000075 [Tulasnella sp. 403]